MSREKKARIGQILSIAQWAILIAVGIILKWCWLLPLLLFIIHSGEAVIYGIPKGKRRGYTEPESLALTWLYGFTWWKYLDAPKDEEAR